MPYFHTNDINIMFFHIPKTGGSSIEKYFSEKFKIVNNHMNLYGWNHPNITNKILFDDDKYEHSLQHMSFRQLEKFQYLFGIIMNDPKLIFMTIVRNPYERIVSDMFFFINELHITMFSTPDDMEKAIETFLTSESNFDNHRMTQYDMLKNENGIILPKINIMRTNTLTLDMQNMGFSDFNFYENKNRADICSDRYMSLLTPHSISLINKYYADDFKYFGYEPL